ncbi:hypothetical protein OCU04_005875 [Sclerotinia nivalis]|uniref:Uncharacterized protein n=1 Tax=Sclerotinia nivalis TaxID=352851 RepID=A0A9X0DKP4_9HELO|nr:hypothetical protein OCU04_005875 [Sclerotinia nivalis]
MATAIGLLLGGLSLIPMAMDLFPPKVEQSTTVRIGAGTSIKSEANTAGNTPGIQLYDVVGRFVAKQGGSRDRIADGGYKDIKLTGGKGVGARQAQYISVSSGGNDALCISYIAVTWPDGGQQTWTGDVGFTCGAFWYESQTILDATTNYMPKCVWLDSDGSNGITTKAMGIHMTDFTPTDDRVEQYRTDPDSMCKSAPRFKLFTNAKDADCITVFDPPLDFTPNTLVDKDRSKVVGVAGTKSCDVKNKRRGRTEVPTPRDSSLLSNSNSNININITTNIPSISNSTSIPYSFNTSAFFGQLIVSNSTSHSAAGLCDSDSSRGPDFVARQEGSDGVYCDMRNKKTYPVCCLSGKPATGACFDVKLNTLRPPPGVAARDIGLPEKEYHTVTQW